jgi:hypothetical protein
MDNSFLLDCNDVLLQNFINNMNKYGYSIFEQNDCLCLMSCNEKTQFSNILNIINDKYNNNDTSSDYI